ncbi:hypothetical protein [Chryseobacterium sp. YR221]|uniref:hypothetical protein n=1 Tax=Chryseobacterium sp. YR221 TaxID=1500293 RepID=UPI0009D86239|nr:hypothetical protein [Chryseobacterium sp. YR221]SMC90206.1 hypothetical protein SAMN02787074_3620 [Chryseobacterium sp. YR221]
MRKKILLQICICFSMYSLAQVGIKKDNPNPSTDLELGSNNKALILNRVQNTSAVPNPVNGMMIYDLSEECVKAYQSGKWSKCLGKNLKANKSSNPLSLSKSSVNLSHNVNAGQSFREQDITYTQEKRTLVKDEILR